MLGSNPQRSGKGVCSENASRNAYYLWKVQVILLNQPLVGWNYLYQLTFLFKFTPLNISYKK